MKQTHAVVAEAQLENALAGITSRKNNTLKEKRSGKKDRHRKKPAKDLGHRFIRWPFFPEDAAMWFFYGLTP